MFVTCLGGVALACGPKETVMAGRVNMCLMQLRGPVTSQFHWATVTVSTKMGQVEGPLIPQDHSWNVFLGSAFLPCR